jgi:flagellar protein FlbT
LHVFLGGSRPLAFLASCVVISGDVAHGTYYKALIACRKLFDFEKELLNYEP